MKNFLCLASLASLLAIASVTSGCSDDSGHGGVGTPAAPTMLTGEVLSGGAHLTWKDNSDNETNFMVMRKEMGAAGDYAVIAMPNFDTTAYHDAPLTAGKTYLYMVQAMNDSGHSDLSNEVMVSIPAAGPVAPAAPTMLTAQLLSGGAHLTWKDNSDNETQFMVMRKEMGAASDYAVIAMLPSDTTAHHDAPLTAGKAYLYMVQAMNDSGHSDPSNEVTISIP